MRTPCTLCKHFQGATSDGQPICQAFPKEIPAQIYWGTIDHDKPVDGDGGVTFEYKDPEYKELSDAVGN